MGLDLDAIEGQTPLEEDEKEDLLIPSVSTRGELNEFEQQNIEHAVQWTMQRTFNIDDVLTESFVKDVHKRMYGDVWKWAGKFRRTNKNLGVDKHEIGIELKKLLDDCNYWIENKIYPEDEIAIRFKHRLVSIHCFANGNGRHSRLMADILIDKVFRKPLFTWGAVNLTKQGEARSVYLKAMRSADAGDYDLLLHFARS